MSYSRGYGSNQGLVLHASRPLHCSLQQAAFQEPDCQRPCAGLRRPKDEQEKEKLPRPHDRGQQVRRRRPALVPHQ